MTFNDYQKFAVGLLSPESKKEQMLNAALGLTGEAGEFADMLKKHRHHGHEMDRTKSLKELGDILFYVSTAADSFDATLEEVAFLNIDKLTKRYPSGVFNTQDSKDKKDEVGLSVQQETVAA